MNRKKSYGIACFDRTKWDEAHQEWKIQQTMDANISAYGMFFEMENSTYTRASSINIKITSNGKWTKYDKRRATTNKHKIERTHEHQIELIADVLKTLFWRSEKG